MTHTEYISDVSATTAFSPTTIELNPGLETTFPWLSQLASAYEMYKWKTLVFTYKSTSSDVISSTSGALGTVTMATDYNSLDGGYGNIREMNNSEFCNSQRPSTSFMHVVDCKKMQQKQYYIRNGPPPANADLRLYDAAITTLATQGMAVAGGGIGQLWVTYTVQFLKPVFDTQRETNSQILYQTNPASCVTFKSPNIALLGSPTTVASYGNCGVNFTYNGDSIQLLFPSSAAGKSYQIFHYINATSAALSGAAYTYRGTTQLGLGGDILTVPVVAPANQISYGSDAGNLQTKNFCSFVRFGAWDEAVPFEFNITPGNPVIATHWPTVGANYTTAFVYINGMDQSSLTPFQ